MNDKTLEDQKGNKITNKHKKNTEGRAIRQH